MAALRVLLAPVAESRVLTGGLWLLPGLVLSVVNPVWV